MFDSRIKTLGLSAALLAASVSLALLSLERPALAEETRPGEKPVTGDSEAQLTSLIDREIKKVWERDGIKPAERASDEEFLRRVYLDTVGVPPTYDEAVAFYADKDENKRARLIDKLVSDGRFGRHIGDLWSVIMMGRGQRDLAGGGMVLAQWLAERVNRGDGFNNIIYDVVTATGSMADNPAVAAYLAAGGNQYKPVDMTGNLTKYFTGVQIQCAQCHKHPYESWTEADFAGMASFFVASNLRVNVRSLPVNPTLVDAPQVPRRAMGDGENLPAEARQRLEEMRKYSAPRVLGGKAVQTQDRSLWRPILAKWMVSPENSQTPRYMANRLWSFVFGSGLLNPVDDFNSFNTPSHPELLDALGRDFAANGWQVKRFFRAALKSQTYQLSSKPAGGKKPEAWHFAHYPVKQLSPEQFMGALVTLAGATDLGRMFKQNSNPYAPIRQRYERLKRGQAEGGENDNMRDYSFDEAALAKFEALFENVPGDWYMRRVLASRYATSSSDDEMTEGDAFTQTIDQALAVMNGDITNRLSGSGRGTLLGGLMNRFKNEEERLHALYLMTLGRRAGKAECSRMLEYVRTEKDTGKAWEDLLFALLATTEFATNH
ncbi:DUF1553 domain-containing protein [bacterium]|nr:MAG: DUF1553 domain-containing protein [bacterium]RIK62697.1 MAG: hypothetical protein DCC64_09055 [Planctomycetota bacterium]